MLTHITPKITISPSVYPLYFMVHAPGSTSRKPTDVQLENVKSLLERKSLWIESQIQIANSLSKPPFLFLLKKIKQDIQFLTNLNDAFNNAKASLLIVQTCSDLESTCFNLITQIQSLMHPIQQAINSCKCIEEILQKWTSWHVSYNEPFERLGIDPLSIYNILGVCTIDRCAEILEYRYFNVIKHAKGGMNALEYGVIPEILECIPSLSSHHHDYGLFLARYYLIKHEYKQAIEYLHQYIAPYIGQIMNLLRPYKDNFWNSENPALKNFVMLIICILSMNVNYTPTSPLLDFTQLRLPSPPFPQETQESLDAQNYNQTTIYLIKFLTPFAQRIHELLEPYAYNLYINRNRVVAWTFYQKFSELLKKDSFSFCGNLG